MGVFGVFVTGADLAFGIDFAGFGEGDFGEQGADELVDEDGEQGDVGNERAACGQAHRLHCHTEGDARLRKEGDAEVFDDVLVAFHESGTQRRAEVFAYATAQNVRRADEDDEAACKHGEFELRARDDEEEYEQRRRPAVYPIHEFFGEVAHVAKDGAEHHTHEQGGKFDVNALYGELDHGQADRQKDKGYGDGKALGTGVEKAFAKAEQHTHGKAERKGEHHFEQGLYRYGDGADAARAEGFGDAERDGEQYEPHRIVKSDDGEQGLGDGAFGFVLTNDH